MSIEATIQSTLAALVSGRCYPLIAPDNTAKPYITFQVISNVPLMELDEINGTENRRLQVDIFDKTYGGAKTLEDSIKSTLAAAAFVKIPMSSMDLFEDETQLYRISMDYSVWS